MCYQAKVNTPGRKGSSVSLLSLLISKFVKLTKISGSQNAEGIGPAGEESSSSSALSDLVLHDLVLVEPTHTRSPSDREPTNRVFGPHTARAFNTQLEVNVGSGALPPQISGRRSLTYYQVRDVDDLLCVMLRADMYAYSILRTGFAHTMRLPPIIALSLELRH